MDFNLFNLQTQKKSQNIHNNNNNNNNNKKKKKDTTSAGERESHSRLVQIPSVRTHFLKEHIHTPFLTDCKDEKIITQKKVTVPKKHHKTFKSTKLSKM
jgi:CRISPR/Cas system CSM-associated protein Csm4 (group 5 of RAMP superfamily)